MTDSMKRSDQIALMKASHHREKTGEWKGLFTYPNCGYDLVRSGLATEDGKLTIAGKAALYLLGDDECDPTTDSKSFEQFNIPLNKP
jgi:hypothetical protein